MVLYPERMFIRMKKIVLMASMDKFDELREFIYAEMEPPYFTDQIRTEIELIVDEVFTNIASYAYESIGGSVIVYLEADEDKIAIKFEDTGKAFNPLELSEPDLDASLSERDIGGLGIHFAKNIMDELNYVYAGKKNILSMTKYLKKD